MRVFHFINEEYGLKSLRERRLKISRILELNDPFEFLCLEMSDRALRQPVMAARRVVGEQFGLLCFSSDWKSPVQWAHYANRHKGLCLGFEIPRSFLEEVSYVEERIVLQGDLTEASVIELLKVKFRDWAYEKEFRAFVPLDERDGEHFYTDFSNDLLLAQVIVGAESSLRRSEIDAVLGEMRGSVEVFKARAAFKKFEMTRNMNEKLWA